LKIIVDAFGGDNAPSAAVSGAVYASSELGVKIVLTGDEKSVRLCAAENGVSLDGVEIVGADSVIGVEEEPTAILKEKQGCSMAVGLKLLADGEGDAFVSAGSTGALVIGATFIAKRLKGVKRAALSPILPGVSGSFMLTDAGANLDCRPDMLVQFGVMGSCYMKIMGVASPKVGLLNVGTEDTKGRELDLEAYDKFRQAPVNFIGNIEARDVPRGLCDVVVTDGFTGNVALKLYEGMGGFFSHTLKDMFAGFPGRLGALTVMSKINAFKKKMNVSETGGAMLTGISKPVIKAHGSSDKIAFYNAIRQAAACVDGNFTTEISNALERIS
jgi:glycerol-3-phosphate acyltransferase PlsX